MNEDELRAFLESATVGGDDDGDRDGTPENEAPARAAAFDEAAPTAPMPAVQAPEDQAAPAAEPVAVEAPADLALPAAVPSIGLSAGLARLLGGR